jgi:hypothetical protein
MLFGMLPVATKRSVAVTTVSFISTTATRTITRTTNASGDGRNG